MASLEIKGKNVDQAIFNGLNELGLTIDQVEIEIIHDGRGLFGLGKSAVVRMTPRDELPEKPEPEKRPKSREERKPPRESAGFEEDEHTYSEETETPIIPADRPSPAEGFLNELFIKMKLDAQCVTVENADMDKIVILGKDTAALIGRRGGTLDALQYITGLVLNRGKQDYRRVMLDTENYRKKREEALVRLANRIAQKVSKTNRKVTLEPMNPYERRILHSTLQPHPKVETISEGEEPFRRVVVRPKRRG